MNRKKPEHWILDDIGVNEYNKAFAIADSRLINQSLNLYCKIDKVSNDIVEKENEFLHEIIGSLEMIVIDLPNQKSNDKVIINEVYQQLFYFTKVLKIPSDEVEKIKFIYKVISYSYLGEMWESGKRYLIENEKEIIVNISEKDLWDMRVFKETYMAFLYLIRKHTWQDLHTACNYIDLLRKEQSRYEKMYLESVEVENVEARAYELVGLYHFAKAIEVTSQFMVNGKLAEIREEIDFHFDKAIEATETMSNLEMNLILQMLKKTIKQMVSNSIWMATDGVNSRISRFVKNITKSNKPIFELLYPQKYAILEKGLLDPAHKAVVVNLPTSSGKTLLAEFRIIQAINQFSDDQGWVAYVAPTKALVNQVTSRLKKELDLIGIKVKKMNGAIELDTFEENLIRSENEQFDVLVATPEKLNLLVREGIEEKIGRPLALVVADEAHNIEDPKRGLNLEMLLANIKNDCRNANFLLLTPFIPNSKELAHWLDPDSPNDIQLQLEWQPNDRIIGAFYPEGRARKWNTTFETLLTSHENIQIEKKIKIDKSTPLNITRSNLSKTLLTAVVTKQLIQRKGILTICKEKALCWNCARTLSSQMDVEGYDEDIELVKRYIATEMGDNFILIKLLDKRIGVHHAGLPEEIRLLMEWLMENEKLKVLIATTTIAQGINFPVSTILMASYAYPYTSEMPIRDFWNLVGRSGRTNQSSLGVIGIAVGEKEAKKDEELKHVRNFIAKSTKKLVSNLVGMVDKSIQIGKEFDLSSQFYKPEWSQFMQYITHMFNQCKELEEFNTKSELFLRRTYGYNSLTPKNKMILLKSVKKYGKKLNENKGLAKLSDSTGFSMEAIKTTVNKVKQLKLTQNDWNGTNLFKNNKSLKSLMGIMLSIPEIKKSLEEIAGKNYMQGDTLAEITSDWVAGVDIEDIAKKYFKLNDECDSITKCCNVIYSKLINSATWGLASLQKLPNSGLNIDELSEEEKRKINNIPAMIYYGVDSDEAVLMRMNSIPRKISRQFAKEYLMVNKDINKSTPSDAYCWISSLDKKDWEKIIGERYTASGADYKRIWDIMVGNE